MINSPEIKIGIMAEPEISFTLFSPYHLININTILPPGNFEAKSCDDKIQLSGTTLNLEIDNFIELNATEKGSSFEIRGVTIGIDFHWEQKEDQRFLGGIILMAENGLVRVINRINLEDYLKSVISSEMSPACSSELLKAHAVISRSWLLSQIEKRGKPALASGSYNTEYAAEDTLIKWYNREDHYNFDVCADDHCQRYHGITKIQTKEAIQAVEQTSGKVMAFRGDICDTRFSKCCGGITESFENAWEPISYPYLSSIVDTEAVVSEYETNLQDENAAVSWIKSSPPAFCNTSDKKVLSEVLPGFDQATTDFFRWKKEYTQEELSKLIKKKSGFDFGKIIRLEPVERGYSGRLIKLRIIGTKMTLIVGKELEIRKWLSGSHLYSSAFVIDHLDYDGAIPAKFIFTGAGWGHGVGLCQIGAAVMGNKGYSYDQILKHYFKGSELIKIY